MAWRFRRSTKIGPFRLTATKTGLSGSVGVPGARVGINSKGQVRRTIGIPGTGLYDTEIVNARTHGHSEQDASPAPPHAVAESAKRRWGAGTTTLFVLMALTILGQAVALASR